MNLSHYHLFLCCFIAIVLSQLQENKKHQSTYYQQWCSENGQIPGACKYLNDIYCQKYFPSNYDRDFKCPNQYSSSYLSTYSSTNFGINSIIINSTALIPFVSNDFYITLILIRRNKTGHPFYKYLSNGNHLNIYQPWSSSKPFAIVNGASSQRIECNNNIGLQSYENNKYNDLGDLSTIIHSYDTSNNMSSNCLAFYFLNIGGRNKLNLTLHNWLNITQNNISLGGNYGCYDAYDLGMNFTSINNQNITCLVRNTSNVVIPNSLSTLISAEFYKRLIMTREELRYSYPNVLWEDVRELLYGPQNSKLFPDIKWGGGTTGTSWYIQSGINDIDKIDINNNGKWRLFNKLGAGYHTASGLYQIANVGYLCLPVSNNNTENFNKGIELILSAWYTYNGSLCDVDNKVQENIASVIQAIVNGTIQ